MNPPVYDKAYFIAKFEAIPEEKWTTAFFRDGGACCALGHCGFQMKGARQVKSREGRRLQDLLGAVAAINDGNNLNYPQPTPKQRILAALRDLP